MTWTTGRGDVVKAQRRPGRLGQSKYPYRHEEEQEQIVKELARGRTNEVVAAMSGWSLEQVRDVRATYFPTTSLAAHYVRANALTLAKRVVAEANVEESLDLLSRPNIGVLKPLEKPGSQPSTTVLTSINPNTLGGVHVAVITGQSPTPYLQPSDEGETQHEHWQPTEIAPAQHPAVEPPRRILPAHVTHDAQPDGGIRGERQGPRRIDQPGEEALDAEGQRPAPHQRLRPPVSRKAKGTGGRRRTRRDAEHRGHRRKSR